MACLNLLWQQPMFCLINKIRGIFRVTHLKGTVKQKKLSCCEKRYVSRLAFPLSSSSPLPQFHSLSVSVSILPWRDHPSALRFQDGVALILRPIPSTRDESLEASDNLLHPEATTNLPFLTEELLSRAILRRERPNHASVSHPNLP